METAWWLSEFWEKVGFLFSFLCFAKIENIVFICYVMMMRNCVSQQSVGSLLSVGRLSSLELVSSRLNSVSFCENFYSFLSENLWFCAAPHLRLSGSGNVGYPTMNGIQPPLGYRLLPHPTVQFMFWFSLQKISIPLCRFVWYAKWKQNRQI